MTCIYNPDPATQAVLDKYSDILGSEEAAYYVLSQNNGFPLTQTPSGEDSILWNDLINQFGDENEAIKRKSIAYTSYFLNKNGDWTMDPDSVDPTILDINNEPKMSFLLGTRDEEVEKIMNNVFLSNNEFNTEIKELSKINIGSTNSNYATRQMLKLSLRDYMDSEIAQIKRQNPNISNSDLHKEKVRIQRRWYDSKVRSIMTEQQVAMATAFGLKYVIRPNGSVELMSDKLNGIRKLRMKFVQNINNDPLENELLNVAGKKLDDFYSEHIEGSNNYISDGLVTRRSADRMMSANCLIYLSLNEGSAVTFSKTLAYHYISMMIDNPMIQTALKSLDDTGNRSTLYLVNKLVDAITEPMIKDSTGTSLINRVFSQNISKDDAKRIEFFNQFWTDFDQLKDKIIKDGVKNADAKNKILSVVAASVALNEEIDKHTASSRYPGRVFGYELDGINSTMDLYSTKYKPDILQIKKKISQEQQFFNQLQTVYENRITRMRRKTKLPTKQSSLVTTLINLQNLKNRNLYNELDQKATLQELLEQAFEEIRDAYDELSSLENDSSRSVLDKALFITTAYNETISYYSTIVGQLLDPLFSKENTKYNGTIRQLRTQVLGSLRDLQNKYNSLLLENTCNQIDEYVDKYVKDGLVSKEDKINMKANYKAWLVNQSQFGDIRIYEPWITMNSNSRSGVIRIALNIIQHANRAREAELRHAAVQLARSLDKCKKALIKKGNAYVIGSQIIPGVNFQEILQEHDANGIPTGYFPRKYNFGVFYQLRNAEIVRITKELQEQIRSKTGNIHFEFEKDENNNPIFPESSFYEPYWKQYQLALNSFDCEYGNKRFVKEYYEMRINTLSRSTIQKQNDLQDRINAIIAPVIENSIPHVERLSDEDITQLYNLRNEEDNLSNLYNPDGSKKQGEELQTALELKKLKELTKDKIKYKQKQTVDENGNTVNLYDYVLSKIEDSKKPRFQKLMSTREINPEFFDIYHKLQEEYKNQFPRSFDSIFDHIKKLNEEKFDIINLVKDRGFTIPNLDEIPDVCWSRLKEIDEEIASAYEPISEWLRNNSNNDLVSSAAAQLAEFKDIMDKIQTDKTYFSVLIENAVQQDEDEFQATGIRTNRNLKEAQDKYTREVYYVDSHGQPQTVLAPLSVFSYFYPKAFSNELAARFNIPSNFEYFVTKPGPEFNELVDPDDDAYENGSFVNKDYDQNYDAFIQPKMLGEEYATIEKNPELKELYDNLTHIMRLGNEMIPFTQSSSRFKLPQMRADSMLGILGRSFENGILNAPKGLIDSFGFIASSTFGINENDDDVNDDFTTMPDGSRVNLLPVRFVQMLTKPQYITRDVVGSVIAYYNMALNYKYKAEIEPLLVQLLQQVGQDQTFQDAGENIHVIKGSNTNQYAKLKNVINSQFYGQESILGERPSKKLSATDKFIIKSSKNLRKVGILSGLARNTFSQTTGFLDAFVESAVFSSSGEPFNQKNYTYAISMLFGNSGKGFYNVGQQLAYGKVAALMQKNGLSKDVARIFKDTHYTHLRRAAQIVSDSMVGFRLADYTINAITMIAVYDNMRFSEKHKLFLSENDFIGRYLHEGYTRQQAVAEYNKSKTLYNSYKEVENEAVLDDDIKSKMSPEDIAQMEREVSTMLKTWTPKFNGAVAEEDKALLQQNIYGSFVTALRTYLINKSQTMLATGDDFQDPNKSKRHIDALIARRNGLQKAKNAIGSESKRDKRIQNLEQKIQKIEQELANIPMPGALRTNIELMKPVAIDAASYAAATVLLGSAASSVFPTVGGIIYGAGSLLTLASSIKTYLGAKKLGTAKSGIVVNKIKQLNDKLLSLRQQLQDIYNAGDISEIDQEIYNLNQQIEELKSYRRSKKGFYDFSRNLVVHGHIRAWANAWNSLYGKFMWMCNVLFRPNYKNTHYKPDYSLSKQQKTGMIRVWTALATLAILWLTASFLLCGYRDNNMEDFLPGKLPVVGKYIKSGAESLLEKENEVLYDAASAVVDNQYWDSIWDGIHNESTEGFISTIPLVNHYVEAISDDMLGYTKSVKSSTGEVVRKKTDKIQSRVNGFKSVLALQSVRLFAEQFTPYDIQTANDLFSSVSAPININFKTVDAGIQLGQGALEGSLQNMVQRGSWAAYFTRNEYILSNAMAPFGLPQAWKSYKEAGRVASLEYRTSLGDMKTFFPKPTSIQNTSKKGRGKNSKKSKSKTF